MGLLDKTNWYEAALLEFSLNGVPLPNAPSGDVWFALHTSNPGETDAAGTEVSGAGYARAKVTSGFTAGGQSSDFAVTTLNQDVLFPRASGAWGTATHITVRNSATSGQAYYHSALDDSYPIVSGDVFVLPSGSVLIGEG